MADENYLGEITIVAFNFAPRGWAHCNGQIMPIAQNQALFSLLGTTYGGNGTTTFALPDFRGRAPMHWGSWPASGNFSIGQVGGKESHTLTINEIPQHQHIINSVVAKAKVASGAANTTGPAGSYFAENALETKRFTALPDTLMGTVPVSTVVQGGTQAHSNMQPYTVLNFVIALQGIFPSRN